MAQKIEISYQEYLAETYHVMNTGSGLLLVSLDVENRPNAMTIGWGMIGIVWRRPIFIVLVRPSRYTYRLIESTGDFTVNVPPVELAEAVELCGTVSGRTHDKLAETGLTTSRSETVKSPLITECVLHYECKVVHKNDIISAYLPTEVVSEYYPQGDFHRIYFGQILRTLAEENVRERLRI